MTRLAPQFAGGMVARSRPMNGLFVEAGIRGMAVPLTAACVGGLIGTALWFTRPPNKKDQHRSFVRADPRRLRTGGDGDVRRASGWSTWHGCPRFCSSRSISRWRSSAVLALRIGLHLALLHEDHDEILSDEPLLCTHCGTRRSRHGVLRGMRRRHQGIVAIVAAGEARRPSGSGRGRARSRNGRAVTTVVQGYSTHAGSYTAPTLPKTSHRRLLIVWVAAIGVVAAGLVAMSGALEKPSARYVCPPECGQPPMGQPVTVNPRYTAADGAFSVSYPAVGTAYKVTTGDHGVVADLQAGDGGTMRLFSEPAAGRTPKDIATSLVKSTFPDTKTAYEIPNAMVGYQPGYGLVADCWPQGSNASYTRMRVVVMVAVKNDLALVAGAVGPYHAFGPDFGSGKPSAVNLQLALDMGKYVNSFSWRGDPQR